MVEDIQLGVESYQKKINLTKPQQHFPNISVKELYTPSFDPLGVIYKDPNKQKRVMRADELYKLSDGILKTVFRTWMAFGGNTHDLSSFREEMDKITYLHQFHEEILFTERGDGITGIKRRRRNLSSDSVRDLVMASGRGRLKEDLESSTLRRRQDFNATPSQRYLYIYKSDFRVLNMTPLPPHDQLHLWLRYQMEGYTKEIDLAKRLRMVYTGDDGQEIFLSHAWRRISSEMGLDVIDSLCFQLGGARRRGGHLQRHIEGRKSGARLSGGHFIKRLAHHFGLGTERQSVAAVTALGGVEDAPYVDKGAQALPAPIHAPPPPPPAAGRTMP
ncbi:hypothetical protein Tco_0103080 [Tanacetum coccineum]